MSYQAYGANTQQQSGYSGYNPYAQQENPFSNQQASGRYGGQQAGGNYQADPEQGGQYEMTPVNGQASRDPNYILNQCREIERGIDSVDQYIEQISSLHRRLLGDADPAQENAIRRQADDLGDETKTVYRNLVERVRAIKSSPESGNPRNAPQVGKVDRRLKKAIQNYQGVQTDFQKGLQAQMARQYRIVRPDASEAEVREAVEDTSNNQQIFSQALIQSDRRGDAQKVSQMVKARHDEIQKIERDFVELAQLFQDLDTLVVQQEDAVQEIERKGEEVTENVGHANTQIDTAIKSARSRRRKKWWCLLIVVIILIIIAVVVALAVKFAGGGK
ncbi:Plasma membrane t-SNARE, secretory vesicle fusion [Arachnomyces sp. PD_36]|nr:Plasma membrane t-SNARE, secretory vesicle fusion [Arachnomyces sp. PD_36]